jgi:hypothetical protein
LLERRFWKRSALRLPKAKRISSRDAVAFGVDFSAGNNLPVLTPDRIVFIGNRRQPGTCTTGCFNSRIGASTAEKWFQQLDVEEKAKSCDTPPQVRWEMALVIRELTVDPINNIL